MISLRTLLPQSYAKYTILLAYAKQKSCAKVEQNKPEGRLSRVGAEARQFISRKLPLS